MNISGWRRRGRVHVGMSVKVDEPERFFAPAVGLGDSAERTDRDRMITADGNRKLARIHNFLNLIGKLAAGGVHFGNMLELLAFAQVRMRSLYPDIADVVHFITQLRDSLRESGHAHG